MGGVLGSIVRRLSTSMAEQRQNSWQLLREIRVKSAPTKQTSTRQHNTHKKNETPTTTCLHKCCAARVRMHGRRSCVRTCELERVRTFVQRSVIGSAQALNWNRIVLAKIMRWGVFALVCRRSAPSGVRAKWVQLILAYRIVRRSPATLA